MDLDPPLHPATNREEEAVAVADLNDPLRPVSSDGRGRGFGGDGRGRGFSRDGRGRGFSGAGRGRIAGRGRGFGGDGGGHGLGGDGRGRGFGGAGEDRGFSSGGCRDGGSGGGRESQDSGGTGRGSRGLGKRDGGASGSIFKEGKSLTKAPEKLKKDEYLTFTKKSKKEEGSSNIMSLTEEKMPTESSEDTEKHGQFKIKRCRNYWPESFEDGVSEEVLQFHKQYGPDASDEKAIEKLKLFWGKGHIMMELRDEGEYREYHCTLCPWSTSRYFHASNHFDSKNHQKKLKRVQFSMLPDAKQWPFNDSLRFFNSTLFDDEVLRDEVMIPLHCGDYELNSYIIGVGKIGIRFQDEGDGMLGVRRIWCEWLGDVGIPRDSEFCQFGLLTFVYPSSVCPMRVIDAGVTNLIKKTNADKVVKGKKKRKRKIKENALPHKKFPKCSVCKQDLLEGKHAATLINIEDKSLLCKPGVSDIFDIGHVSCLVNWVLACEFQKLANMIPTFFCPPCMGTGQEESSITYQHRNYVLNTLPAGKAWETDFEKLEKNSTGLTPEHPGEYKEFLRPWKYLKFYKGVPLKQIRTDEKYSAGEHAEGSSDFVGHANSDQRYSDGEHAEGFSDFLGHSNSDEKYSAGEHAEGSSDFVGHANSDQSYSDGETCRGIQ